MNRSTALLLQFERELNMALSKTVANKKHKKRAIDELFSRQTCINVSNTVINEIFIGLDELILGMHDRYVLLGDLFHMHHMGPELIEVVKRKVDAAVSQARLRIMYCGTALSVAFFGYYDALSTAYYNNNLGALWDVNFSINLGVRTAKVMRKVLRRLRGEIREIMSQHLLQPSNAFIQYRCHDRVADSITKWWVRGLRSIIRGVKEIVFDVSFAVEELQELREILKEELVGSNEVKIESNAVTKVGKKVIRKLRKT
ncbi:hypothetical protein PUMCH_001560 [Australozyma saopauloensis]|uniref:Uncharacterized protein n=1 Tax=Australozyma saopauloensis TaxID=291208 RepID=A0AAX4H761_9ASCO|nr:hypothetical protein PUMCH_001560 [[Candida] saopauloensis]